MMGRNATSLDGNFAIMDEADQLRILKQTMEEQSIDLKSSGCKPMDILNAVLDIKGGITKEKDPLESPSSEQKKSLPKRLQIAKKIYGAYRETMLSNNLLDFDDLIYLAREMISEHQEVRQQLHRRWKHILVVCCIVDEPFHTE
jgi:DNA helicase II / ATP-dependent DNA helicase PcrA